MLVLSFTFSKFLAQWLKRWRHCSRHDHISWRGLHLLPKWRTTHAYKKSRTQFLLSETCGIIYHPCLSLQTIFGQLKFCWLNSTVWFCLLARACLRVRSSVVYDGARRFDCTRMYFPARNCFWSTQFENISLLLLSSEFFLNFLM